MNSVKGKNHGEGESLSDAEFQRVRNLILRNLGFYYPEARRFQVEQALRERLEEKKILNFKDYFDFLETGSQGDPEWKALSNILSIRETSFFRNRPQFGVLKDFIIPRLIKERGAGNRSIRIWSAGCSTGQEPYSIGMILLDALPEVDTWNISLLATDISTLALDQARKGQYGPLATRSLRESDKIRFFKAAGEDLVISKSLRKMVVFAEHNLVNEPYTLPGMQNVDVIFCRNVTIYFNLETTRRVNDKFFDCLGDQGVLFIGHSETLWKISDRYKVNEFARTYVYQKGGEGRVEKKKNFPRPFSGIQQLSYETRKEEKRSPIEIPAGKKLDPKEAFKVAVRAVEAKQYDEAVSLFRGFQPGDPHYLRAKMDMAVILANQAKYEEAISVLEELIKENSLDEWAYYHLGVLHNRKGEARKACEYLEKTLYVNPKNVVASYHLAEILFRKKDFKKARQSFESTLKNLGQLPEDEVLPYSGDITPDTLTLACHRQLKVLKQEMS